MDEDPALDARALECFQAATQVGNHLGFGRIAQHHQARSRFAESNGYWERFFGAFIDRIQAEFDMLEPASTIFDFPKIQGTTRRWFRKTLDPHPIPAPKLGSSSEPTRTALPT